MIYKGIAAYLERIMGVTEFWLSGKRIIKTTEGEWIAIKD